MKGTSVINPKHYDLIINGHKFQAVDVIEARFAEDAHLSQAVKYLLRAGHKTDSSYVKDVGKCVWWCVRALMFNKVKHIELPAGAPVHVESLIVPPVVADGDDGPAPMSEALRTLASLSKGKPKRKYTRKATKKVTTKKTK